MMECNRNESSLHLSCVSSVNTNGNDEGEIKSEMRIGDDYQAVIPDLIPHSEKKFYNLVDREICLWHMPTEFQLSDQDVNNFISYARNFHGYQMEQALGLLSYTKHDLVQAVKDLKNFTPCPNDDKVWSIEDKALFALAFEMHGKNFIGINEVLPQKSLGALVEYYYLSKNKMPKKSRRKRKRRNWKLMEEKSCKSGNYGSSFMPKKNIFTNNSKMGPHTNFQLNKNMNHHHQQHKPAIKTEKIKLNVLGPNNIVVCVKLFRHNKLKNLMKKYCNEAGFPMAEAHFSFDGVKIKEHHTPQLLEMYEGDTINVYQDG